MTFNLTDNKGTDQNGLTITQLVVPEQATPYPYGEYGLIYYADGLTRQSVNSPSFMYDDYYCKILMQWYVSVSNLGQISGYDTFEPNE